MKVCVLDFEMNQPSNSPIQLGAVCLNMRSGKVVSSFNHYMNPGEVIDPFIVNLTGITQEMSDKAQPPKEVLTKFWEWAKKENMKIIVGWGTDVEYLRAMTRHYRADHGDHKHRALDAKAMFQIIKCGFPSGKIKGGLKATLDMFGIEFEGAQHDAYYDALNTAKLLVYAKDMQFNMLGIEKIMKSRKVSLK